MLVGMIKDVLKRALASGAKDAAAHHQLAAQQNQAKQTEQDVGHYVKTFVVRFGLKDVSAPMDVMRRCLEKIIAHPATIDRADEDNLSEFGALLQRCGTYEREGMSALELVHKCIDDGRVTGFQVILIADALAFKIVSSNAWNLNVFQHVLLPSLKCEISAQRFRYVLEIEKLIYNELVRQVETEENFYERYVRLVPLLREAGRTARLSLGGDQRAHLGDVSLKVAFLLHSSTMLAHTTLLLEYLAGYRKLADQPFTPVVFVFNGTNPVLAERLKAHFIDVCFLDQKTPETQNDDYRRLLFLRNCLQRDSVTELVWVSAPYMMVFASAMGMAPIQVWWSMKYHGIETPEIDGYVTGGSLLNSKVIGGRTWRTAPVAYDVMPGPGVVEQAAQLRREYDEHEILIGTLAREQKLTDPRYLASIVHILRQHRNVAYIWTGRAQLLQVQSAFEQGGVADRCYFVGWVDTKVYAQLIDIFLDSYPFPCTTTILEAMAAGRPVVFFQSEESYRTGLHGILTPVLDGESEQNPMTDRLLTLLKPRQRRPLFLCAHDPQEYVKFAEALIADASFRNEVGGALRQVVREFFINRELMAAGYTKHFVAIVDEVRGRLAQVCL